MRNRNVPINNQRNAATLANIIISNSWREGKIIIMRKLALSSAVSSKCLRGRPMKVIKAAIGFNCDEHRAHAVTRNVREMSGSELPSPACALVAKHHQALKTRQPAIIICNPSLTARRPAHQAHDLNIARKRVLKNGLCARDGNPKR